MRLLDERPPQYNNEEIFKLRLLSNSAGVIGRRRYSRTVQQELIIDGFSKPVLNIYDIRDQSEPIDASDEDDEGNAGMLGNAERHSLNPSSMVKDTARRVKIKMPKDKEKHLLQWITGIIPYLEQEDYRRRAYRGNSFDRCNGWLLEVYVHTSESKDKMFVYCGNPLHEQSDIRMHNYRTFSDVLRRETGIPYLFAFDGGVIDFLVYIEFSSRSLSRN